MSPELKDMLNFNPETGEFTWKVDRGVKTKTGMRAGYLNNYGYTCIEINRKFYTAHRLAWYFMTGEILDHKLIIDHINGIKTDNRIINLRAVSHRINAQNAKKHREGHLVGATKLKNGKYTSAILVNLGVFETSEDANKAYLDACYKVDVEGIFKK